MRNHFAGSCLLLRSHLWGEEVYTQMGFFVQAIFADRYLHRREILVASLKSSSCPDFEKKYIVLNFAFSKEFSRFKVLCEQVIFGIILFTFS